MKCCPAALRNGPLGFGPYEVDGEVYERKLIADVEAADGARMALHLAQPVGAGPITAALFEDREIPPRLGGTCTQVSVLLVVLDRALVRLEVGEVVAEQASLGEDVDHRVTPSAKGNQVAQVFIAEADVGLVVQLKAVDLAADAGLRKLLGIPVALAQPAPVR